jgi:hypothetical protein
LGLGMPGISEQNGSCGGGAMRNISRNFVHALKLNGQRGRRSGG